MASYTYELLELGDEHALPCKCCRFSNATDLPIPKALSDDEIAGGASRFSISIFTNFTQLNAIIKRFQPIIQKRWIKKPSKQKRELLLKAWPDMAPTHRPDFVNFRDRSRAATPRSRTLPSEAYLWPYINLDDLQQRGLLLLFLESRGRHFPDLFVSADYRATHLGKGWPSDTSGHASFMQLLGQRSPRSYGKIVRKTGVNLTYVSNGYHPSTGLLVLEIQQGIYKFLLTCAKLILHDIDEHQIYLAPYQPAQPVQTRPGDVWPSLASQALENTYRLPQEIDLERLIHLVDAKRASAEDHLWMLKEDPGYFADTMVEWQEHDRETIGHSCYKTYQRSTGIAIASSFTPVILWHEISDRLHQMPSIQAQMQRADIKTLRLCPADRRRWIDLVEIIDHMMAYPLRNLTEGLPVSPRMRYFYDTKAKGDKSASVWTRKGLCNRAQARVDNLFRTICSAESRQVHKLRHLTQELQYMLDVDHDAADFVDAWVLGHFSDLAMLSELKECIERLQPWYDGWQTQDVYESSLTSPPVQRACDQDYALGITLVGACEASEYLLNPKQYNYPAMKRRTKETVQQMRLVEDELDLFWCELDDIVEGMIGINPSEALLSHMSLDTKRRIMYRTPVWKEPLSVSQLKGSTAVSGRVLGQIDGNVPKFHRSTATSVNLTPTSKTKVKVKTRGVTNSTPTSGEELSPEPANGGHDESESSPLPPIIKLPKRAFKVFTALLPSPSAAEHHRQEIAWEELLQALNTIGLQPEKLYGSVWQFQPKANKSMWRVELKRSIQFHEPKEVRRGNKIGAHMVRTLGRRLKHAFGWEGGMFECE